MEFNEYLAGECVALMMVFITYLCFGLAFVLFMWYYCVISRRGADVIAWLLNMHGASVKVVLLMRHE